jgi:preprotein translocase subunit SecE
VYRREASGTLCITNLTKITISAIINTNKKQPKGCFRKQKNMNLVEATKNYFIGAYREMRKVSWPTKKQTINYSLLVIGLSIGMAIFFSILDYFFNLGIESIIK